MNNSKQLTSSIGQVDRVVLDGKRDYDVVVDYQVLEGLAERISDYLPGKQCAIVSNPVLRAMYVDRFAQALKDHGMTVHVIDIPAGEQFKQLETVSAVLDNLLSLRLERRDGVIALGGGVIGDMAGFVSSIYLRGIHLIQIPTTLLSQVDAAIGGKTGVNHPRGKNLIGAFYQPKLVLADVNTLTTLDKREFRAGMAEVVKYGVISNSKLFEELEHNLNTIKEYDVAGDPKLWVDLVATSAFEKVRVVSEDEREKGLRETLNFGHTIGHGIEAATKYNVYLHGEAVAVGMLAASRIAVEMKLWTSDDHDRLHSLLNGLDFFLGIRQCSKEDVFDALFNDKKVRSGKLRFILPTAIGTVEARDDVPHDLIRATISDLMV